MDLVYAPVRDVVHALRLLRRSPAFTLTAAASLAIGIAGNAAIFGLADALLLRDRPGISESASLVDIGRTTRGEGFDNMSYPNFADLRERATAFSGMAGYRIGPEPMGLGVDSGAERIFGQTVSGNYFDVLGVRMAHGRGFLASEDRVGAPSFVTVISHHLWRQRFDGAADIVGRTIRLNGHPFAIVGVAADGFTGNTIARSDLWIPIAAYPTTMGRAADTLTSRRTVWMVAAGRLAPGVTFEQALAQVVVIGDDLRRAFPRENEAKGFTLLPSHRLPGELRSYASAFVGLLFALVGLVLAIACVNVAGMLLARSLARAREVAVRLAMGAARGRIVRQLVAENLVLSAASACLGLAMAAALIPLIRGFLPALPIPIALDLRLDWAVAGFLVGVSVLTGVLFGLVPALQAARTDLLTAMKVDARAGASKRFGVRHAFVVAQIAMSTLLLITAVLLGRSVNNAAAIDPGFEIDNVEVATLDFRLGGYTDETGPRAQGEILNRMQHMASVASAAYAVVVPLTGSGFSLGTLSRSDRPEGDPIQADWNVVSPGYFATMRSAMVRGRIFTDADRIGSPDVAIVNETFAKRVWPGQDPIGLTLAHQGDTRRVLHVIGVARDAKYRSIGEEPRAFVYVPLAQNYVPELTLLVKTDGSRRVVSDIRAVVSQVNRNLPLVHTASLAETTAIGLVPHRLAAGVAGGFGIIGIVLAAIGLYGITAYSVTQRTREIGIRVAVGARTADVLRLVITQAMRLAAAGAAIGIALAAGITQLLTGLLYGIRPLDPASFGAGTMFLALLALFASWLPARRAAAVNPVEALRAE
jgi:predicted permease